MAIKPTDVEIMMYLDGELDGEQSKEVARYLEANEHAASVAASIGQVSELVRGSVDLDADTAEDKLAGLWAGIDKAINDTAMSSNVSKEETSNDGLVISIQAKAEEKATEKLVSEAGWFGGWQSHVVIGAFAAAAAFLIMFAQRGDTSEPAVAKQSRVGGAQGGAGSVEAVRGANLQPRIVPVTLRFQEPEIEALEVYDGSGVIMTVPADAESDEAATAVIWISSDTDVVEDPI
ncbi:MAG: hypothetical protein GY811_07790 [Myxococcales bacterium]|nr:hypothetical protein [Myxococcales bacterium]